MAVAGGPAPGTSLPWASTPRPCFSASLTRVQQFADSVVRIMVKEIRNRQPIDTKELESLEVPSLCEFPAGKLVAGLVPNVPETEGQAGLASTLFPSRFNDFTIFGDITQDGVPDTVVVLKCSTVLGGPGADTVAAYDSQGKLLGSVNLASITKQARNDVYLLTVGKGGKVTMRWATTRASDEACCPTVDVAATFTYDATKGIVPGKKLESFNETTDAQKLLTAVKRGWRGVAAKLASPEIASDMFDAEENYGGLGSAKCYGSSELDSGWPAEAIEAYGSWPPVDGLTHGDRFCLIDLDGEPVALLGMQHLGFREWKAVEFLIPSDSPTVDETEGPGPLFPDPFPTFEPDDGEDGPGPLFPGPLQPARAGEDANGETTPPPGRTKRN